MTATAFIRPEIRFQRLEDGIVTVLPEDLRDHPYDRIARLYDRVVGNPLYNRFAWGNWPRAYASAARYALKESHGPFLDAGCGSLVFTAPVYATVTDRPLVLLDRSLAMLRQARERLIRQFGKIPDHILLIQADIFDLPFRNSSFGAAAAWGMLHLFDEVSAVATELLRVSPQAWFTSLVLANRRGDRLLQALHRKGEAALPRTAPELSRLIEKVARVSDLRLHGNMAYGRFAGVERATGNAAT
ncbi:class I SAM-dependent methyltransferase [Thiohalomonas denitrificans]|uniref:Methyltransferase domain-containing protein n=1 Tax=Thiohalomonas denitrificans TaxID=415747 RepID=A0A1G5PSS4_9GAMM|nr:class I SAM-dependent methyltransferase [Thiohalomonas denitrificans]SCZ52241.1 Methyltransferase domain-containing protein [Thiohalomonas denitrificans]